MHTGLEQQFKSATVTILCLPLSVSGKCTERESSMSRRNRTIQLLDCVKAKVSKKKAHDSIM